MRRLGGDDAGLMLAEERSGRCVAEMPASAGRRRSAIHRQAAAKRGEAGQQGCDVLPAVGCYRHAR